MLDDYDMKFNYARSVQFGCYADRSNKTLAYTYHYVHTSTHISCQHF